MANAPVLQRRQIGGLYQVDVTASDEFLTVESWFVIQLAGLAAGGVFQYPAPEGTPCPYIVFRYMSALPDQYSYGANAPAVTPLQYRVWAVDQAEHYETVSPIAAAIKAALNAVQLAVTGGTIYRSRRVLAQKDEELEQ